MKQVDKSLFYKSILNQIENINIEHGAIRVKYFKFGKLVGYRQLTDPQGYWLEEN